MCRAYPSSRGLKHRRARAPKDPSPVVITSARLEDAATAGARAAVTLPFERLAQRSFRQLGADLDALAAGVRIMPYPVSPAVVVSAPKEVGKPMVREDAILLVEDNADDELMTRRTLKKNNVCNEVVVARDGAEALEYLFATGRYEGRNQSVMPQVVLLDLDLPKIDGLEVLRRIRADERTRLLPVVILTSSEDQEDVVAGYGLGANSFVRKPVDVSEFRAAVGQLGMYWMVLNETPEQAVRRGDTQALA